MRDHDASGALEQVTVIIPTLAKAERASVLETAVDSVLSQEGVQPAVLVVLNGHEREPSLVRALQRRPGVSIVDRREAHLGDALQAGRAAVDSPWFAELDDDDILLPGALASRVTHLQTCPNALAVITNGWLQRGTSRSPAVLDMPQVAADPLAALAHGTWLLPGGALFRTDAVAPEVFEDLPRYLEWTCLALRLVRLGNLAFLDAPGFVHYEARADGLWGSPECVVGLPDALRRLLAIEVPAPLRKAFSRRLANACNAAAVLEHNRRRWRSAWRWHLDCLACGGWRYLPFTRKLLPGLNGGKELS